MIKRITLALLAVVVLGVMVTGAALFHQGYRIYVIHTGSMTPNYDSGSIVIDRPGAVDLKPGTVITFRHGEGADLVTHRITDITAQGMIHTKGDGNRTADVWNIPMSMVQGTVIAGIPKAGYLLVFFKQPTGIAAIAAGVFALCLLWSLFFPGAPAERPEPKSSEPVDGPPKQGGKSGKKLPVRSILPGKRHAHPARHAGEAQPQYAHITSMLS